MKKVWYIILISLCVLVLFVACGDVEEQISAPAEEPAAQDDSVQMFHSDFGYSLEYDPAVFYVLTDETSDSFGLWNDAADADLSVAVNVERVRGYSVSEYTDIITATAESGTWSVTEAEFGAAHKKATTVMYEEKTDAGLVYHAVTLAKDGTDLFVVETITYEGISDEKVKMIRDMLLTFKY